MWHFAREGQGHFELRFQEIKREQTKSHNTEENDDGRERSIV